MGDLPWVPAPTMDRVRDPIAIRSGVRLNH